MACPNTPRTTYIANRTPAIKADDLNAFQSAINGIINGTFSLGSVNIDSTGGNVVTPMPGKLTAQTGDFSGNASANNFNAINNVSALNSLIALTGEVRTLIGDISSAKDVIANNALVGNYAQLARSVGGSSFPNTTVPIGQINRGNTVLGWADIDGRPMLPVLIGGVNVNGITHGGLGGYVVKFNVDCTRASAHVTVATGGGVRCVRAGVSSLAPLEVTIIITDTLNFGQNERFNIQVVGE